MNTRETAKILECSLQTVNNYARKGVIPCRVIQNDCRNTYIFDRAKILEFKVGESKKDAREEKFEMDLDG